MSNLIGYARVSTKDQSLDLQVDALKEAGCSKIFHEVASGSKSERDELNKLIEYIREGDTLVVWKLDRLGRSMRNLIQIITDLKEMKIGFKSLNDPIDTTTSQGMLIFNIFSSLAEFETDLIRERTMAGLKSARKRGVVGGKPRSLNQDQVEQVMLLYYDKTFDLKSICVMYKITRRTLNNYVAKHKKGLLWYQVK